MSVERLNRYVQSSKYQITLKCYKGEAYGLELYGKFGSRTVLVHDANLLAQYDLTLKQLEFIGCVEKLANNPPYKVPCSIEEIIKRSRELRS